MKNILTAILALAAAGGAQAHHSAAQFDETKLETIQGTVLKFQWTNPHIFIQLLVGDPSGQAVEWSIEAPNPGGMARLGWNSASLKPGDKITLTYIPLRTGGPGGFVNKVVLADGRALGQTEVQRAREKGATTVKTDQQAQP